MDASRLLPVLRVLRFSWHEIAPQAPSSTLQAARFGEDFFVQRKVDTGYLGPKTPATHLAGASKQGIQRHTRPLQHISFDKNSLNQLDFCEVATSGNLWSAVLQASKKRIKESMATNVSTQLFSEADALISGFRYQMCALLSQIHSREATQDGKILDSMQTCNHLLSKFTHLLCHLRYRHGWHWNIADRPLSSGGQGPRSVL